MKKKNRELIKMKDKRGAYIYKPNPNESRTKDSSQLKKQNLA